MSILADMHNHSDLSPDGCDSPIQMAQRACGLGVRHFALTDHIEIEKFDKWDYAGAIKKSHRAYLEIKELFGDKMEIYYGAELGQPLYDPALADRVLSENDYDFILGSQHRTRSYPYLNKIPDTAQDRKRCLDEYFEDLLALAEWGRFCSLSHLTFPLRFIAVDSAAQKPVLKYEIDLSPYRAVIDKILETIISKGIALEVNSSGIRKGLGVSMPDAEYVRRYKALGGGMITVGSDAHRVADAAADIPQCLEMIKECGFNEICVFRKKQPIFINF